MAAKVNPDAIPGAGSVGQADQNESTPAEQRVVAPQLPKTDGPRIDLDTNTYLPAEYTQKVSTVNAAGEVIPMTVIRRDR